MTTEWSLESWRRPAMWFLVAVLVVAAAMLVLDGGRPAVAAGDCQYQPYGDPCPKATPTLTSTPQPTVTQVGSWLSNWATLSGGNAPTGTITFRLYASGDEACSNPVYTSQGPAFGNTQYYSGSHQARTVGTWRWTVSYSGDDQNEPVSTGCNDATVTVTKASPYAYLSSSWSATIGSWIWASGNAYGGFEPTGSLTLELYRPSDASCSGPPVSTQTFPWYAWGSASIWAQYGPVDALGTWRYALHYAGDVNNKAISLSCGTASVQVLKASPYIGAGVSPSAITIGEHVSVSGPLYGGYRPSGAVAVSFFAPSDPGCSSPVATHTAAIAANGWFETTFAPTSVGTWRIVASYGGDDFNNPTSTWCGAMAVGVAKASPTLVPAASPTTAETGTRIQALTLVQGGYHPGGRVAFRLYRPDDPTCTGLPAYIEEASVAGGVASTSTGFVPEVEGTWRWQAVYLGDVSNNGATSGCDTAPVAVVARLGTPPRDPGGTPFVTNVYFNCLGDHNIGVAYGNRLVLRFGWGASTERQIRGFLGGTTTRAVIDGRPVGNADQYWSKPIAPSTAGGLWITRWEYDTGRVVTSYTQPFTVAFEVVATKAGTDGTSTWNAGDVLVSTGPCLVNGFQPT